MKSLLGFLFVCIGFFSGQSLVYAQQSDIPLNNGSLNWAGYVANQGVYTSVHGTWVVPVAVVSANGTADATWVGIGGTKTADLIQAGTQAIIEHGSVSYYAWVETLPGSAQIVPLTVHGADSITTKVEWQQGNDWLISITNNTTGQNFQTTVNYNSSLTSAEWVEEMVSNINGTFRPLDSFGTATFIDSGVTVNGQSMSISQSGAVPLQMVTSSGNVLATPSVLNADGASFSVYGGDNALSNYSDTTTSSPIVPTSVQVIVVSTPPVPIATTTPAKIIAPVSKTPHHRITRKHHAVHHYSLNYAKTRHLIVSIQRNTK